MHKLLVLLAGLLVATSCVKRPSTSRWTPAQREWALGTSALLNQLNGDRFDQLAGAANPSLVALRDRDLLARVWGIDSREHLLQKIAALVSDKADQMRMGWNYIRAVNLARWGYAAGFLREEEAWGVVMPSAQALQQTFTSWPEMGMAYLDARRKWYSDRPEDRRQAEYAYRVVVLNAQGPWRKYAWNLDLGNHRPIRVVAEKVAWITVAPHREGLISVRLGVPDHSDGADHTDQDYLNAIQKAVGCQPRVTGNRHDPHDWVLDTECNLKTAVRGSQLVAQLRIEAIAEQLRHEGFTQLFSYIQHEPYGSSELVPAAYDNFVQDGLQWYIEMRSLKTPIPDVTLIYGIPPGDGQTLATQ